MFELINVVSNAVDSVNALTITQNGEGKYTVSLGIVLQPNSDYILNIVTQNSVGASISGPYKFSKSENVNVSTNRQCIQNCIAICLPLQLLKCIHCLFIIPTGTHEIQDFSVTVYTHQVCVGCVFTDWAKTNSCQVTIYSEITQTIKSISISSTTTTLTNCTGDIPPGYYHILAYGTDNRTDPAVKKYHYINTTLPQGTLYANRDFYFYFLIHVVEPQLILTTTTKATETTCVYSQTSMITNTAPVDIASKFLCVHCNLG